MELTHYKKRKIPDTPGVYFFLGPKKELLYIGKATSLKDRTRSYFASDLHATRGPLLVEMLQKAKTIDWRETDSVLEALILEANLIHSHQPPYNTDLKDDKSWNYVVITKEDFPRVLVVRGKNLEIDSPAKTRLYTFGPFPHGLQLRAAMKLIRKIFPFRDTCAPAPELLAAGKRPKSCFNAHIGLCPGVCSGSISKTDYRKIVHHIVLLFQGKKKLLITSLEREMKLAAKEEKFELAAQLRSQAFALNHIQDISLIKDEYRSPSATLGGSSSTRIEAYDVAHLGGSAVVGVMTVVVDGVAEKNEYRKFRIKQAKGGDDPGALREILSRRLGHNEWLMPRLIVVDGSTAQVNAAESVLKKYGIQIPVVGVVKDEKHRPRGFKGDQKLVVGRERDILLANAEAHRFAIGYHRKTSRAEHRMVGHIEKTIR